MTGHLQTNDHPELLLAQALLTPNQVHVNEVRLHMTSLLGFVPQPLGGKSEASDC